MTAFLQDWCYSQNLRHIFGELHPTGNHIEFFEGLMSSISILDSNDSNLDGLADGLAKRSFRKLKEEGDILAPGKVNYFLQFLINRPVLIQVVGHDDHLDCEHASGHKKICTNEKTKQI